MEQSNCNVSWKMNDDGNLAVRIENKGEWLQEFLVISDAHFDNPHCDRKLLRSLLDEARKKKAPVFILGDWFDAMQSRDDPRRTKDELDIDLKSSSYLNRLVSMSYDFLKDYADLIALIAEGNHYSLIRRKLEADLLEFLTDKLKVPRMGYSGFVAFRFRNKSSKSHRYKKIMFYHHGSGMGGEVTKGTMRAQRQQAWAAADIYVGGHVHEEWRIGLRRVGLTNSDKVHIQDTLHLCVPTLKEDFHMKGGYHIERGRPPKPIGGMWLRFYHNPRKHGNIGMDALKAD